MSVDYIAPETWREDALLDRLVDLENECHVLAARICASDQGRQLHGSTDKLLDRVVPSAAGADPTVQRQIHFWQKRFEKLSQSFSQLRKLSAN